MENEEQQGPQVQPVRIFSNATAIFTETKERSYLPAEGLRYTGISREIPLPPLLTLKWGLGGGGSWFHPFQSLRSIVYTWAPLGWHCIPRRCSITGLGYDLAFPLQLPSKLKHIGLYPSYLGSVLKGLFVVPIVWTILSPIFPEKQHLMMSVQITTEWPC